MRVFSLILSGALLFFAGCTDEYIDTKETVVVLKRKVLVEQVEAESSAQQEAKTQFTSALAQFLAVAKSPSANLQTTYEKLNSEFKNCEARAKEVRDGISAIDTVAQALFAEWNLELTQYTNPTLRTQSERQLTAMKSRYVNLMGVMEQAATRMNPVIGAFRDQVLFLKHNLNAQAVSAISSTTQDLQQDISRLIVDIEKSIKESDAFIASMQTMQ